MATKAKATVVVPDKVTITLPRVTRPDEPNFRLVGLNGKFYKVMKGVPVAVPVAVAEILANAADAEQAALDFITKNAQ